MFTVNKEGCRLPQNTQARLTKMKNKDKYMESDENGNAECYRILNPTF